jgi:hypothetical protein
METGGRHGGSEAGRKGEGGREQGGSGGRGRKGEGRRRIPFSFVRTFAQGVGPIGGRG